MTTDRERYDWHLEQANYWLNQSDERSELGAANECVATAQVHATLAAAVATANLAFSGIAAYVSDGPDIWLNP